MDNSYKNKYYKYKQKYIDLKKQLQDGAGRKKRSDNNNNYNNYNCDAVLADIDKETKEKCCNNINSFNFDLVDYCTVITGSDPAVAIPALFKAIECSSGACKPDDDECRFDIMNSQHKIVYNLIINWITSGEVEKSHKLLCIYYGKELLSLLENVYKNINLSLGLINFLIDIDIFTTKTISTNNITDDLLKQLNISLNEMLNSTTKNIDPKNINSKYVSTYKSSLEAFKEAKNIKMGEYLSTNNIFSQNFFKTSENVPFDKLFSHIVQSFVNIETNIIDINYLILIIFRLIKNIDSTTINNKNLGLHLRNILIGELNCTLKEDNIDGDFNKTIDDIKNIFTQSDFEKKLIKKRNGFDHNVKLSEKEFKYTYLLYMLTLRCILVKLKDESKNNEKILATEKKYNDYIKTQDEYLSKIEYSF